MECEWPLWKRCFREGVTITYTEGQIINLLKRPIPLDLWPVGEWGARYWESSIHKQIQGSSFVDGHKSTQDPNWNESNTAGKAAFSFCENSKNMRLRYSI